jgi:hypothetical protein
VQGVVCASRRGNHQDDRPYHGAPDAVRRISPQSKSHF